MKAPPVYASADRLARWTRRLLQATVATSLVGILFDLLELRLYARFAQGASSMDEWTANAVRQDLLGVVMLLVYVGVVLAFLAWFHRAHRNLRAIGAEEVRFASVWAVIGFAIPVVGLILPFQVMREVWHGSRVPGRSGSLALVRWWWGLYLLSGLIGVVAAVMAMVPDPELPVARAATMAMMVSESLEVVGALVTIRLVRRITEGQAERVAHLPVPAAEGEAPAAPGPALEVRAGA